MLSPVQAWDVSTASTNLEVPSLPPAELAARKITTVEIGKLVLPTGRIVACDPLVAGDDWPALERTVLPGTYPVAIFEAKGRVAMATVRFGAGNPAKWELATVPGEKVDTLKADEYFGYPVDAGLGSFMDVEAQALFNKRGKQAANQDPNFNVYDDVLAAEFAPNDDRFAMHQPDPNEKANIAMVWSGWGDGYYPSFWGLDAAGKPILLMTDFQVLENSKPPLDP